MLTAIECRHHTLCGCVGGGTEEEGSYCMGGWCCVGCLATLVRHRAEQTVAICILRIPQQTPIHVLNFPPSPFPPALPPNPLTHHPPCSPTSSPPHPPRSPCPPPPAPRSHSPAPSASHPGTSCRTKGQVGRLRRRLATKEWEGGTETGVQERVYVVIDDRTGPRTSTRCVWVWCVGGAWVVRA